MSGESIKRILFFLSLLVGLVALGVLAAGSAYAQSAEDCIDCHEDEDLTKNEGSRVISLFVDLDKYRQSIHGQEDLECVDCHQDVEDFDGEHEDELEEVDCGNCHDDIAEIYAGSLHGVGVAQGIELAPRCWTCHGAHNILPARNPESRVNKFNIPIMCGRCHKEGEGVSDFVAVSQDSILANYSLSIHGEGLYKRGLTNSAVCSDCHSAHNVRNHNDPESTIHRDRVAETCQQCHGLIETVHQKVIQGELWEKDPSKVPVCIECHEPHEVRRVYYDEGMSDMECLTCHQDHNLTGTLPGSEGKALYVDNLELDGSAHKKTACIQCHTGATPSHERPCDTIPTRVDCSICHAEEVQIFKTGIHGRLRDQGDPDAPDCTTCHGTHGTLKHESPASPTHVRQIPNLCGRCHDNGGVADKRYEGTQESMVANYKKSVHGRGL